MDGYHRGGGNGGRWEGRSSLDRDGASGGSLLKSGMGSIPQCGRFGSMRCGGGGGRIGGEQAEAGGDLVCSGGVDERIGVRGLSWRAIFSSEEE